MAGGVSILDSSAFYQSRCRDPASYSLLLSTDKYYNKRVRKQNNNLYQCVYHRKYVNEVRPMMSVTEEGSLIHHHHYHQVPPSLHLFFHHAWPFPHTKIFTRSQLQATKFGKGKKHKLCIRHKYINMHSDPFHLFTCLSLPRISYPFPWTENGSDPPFPSTPWNIHSLPKYKKLEKICTIAGCAGNNIASWLMSLGGTVYVTVRRDRIGPGGSRIRLAPLWLELPVPWYPGHQGPTNPPTPIKTLSVMVMMTRRTTVPQLWINVIKLRWHQYHIKQTHIVDSKYIHYIVYRYIYVFLYK